MVNVLEYQNIVNLWMRLLNAKNVWMGTNLLEGDVCQRILKIVLQLILLFRIIVDHIQFRTVLELIKKFVKYVL